MTSKEEKGVRLGRRILFPLYLDPQKKAQLRKLSESTRVPMAVYLREAVDDLLKKYARELKR